MNKAEEISSKQKQIAVSEFFEKNKHFLGFDSLQRSIITAVKECVDNSLDACEEARILPNIHVELNKQKGDKIEFITQDNGPGIPRNAIEDVFGKFQLSPFILSFSHELIIFQHFSFYADAIGESALLRLPRGFGELHDSYVRSSLRVSESSGHLPTNGFQHQN